MAKTTRAQGWFDRFEEAADLFFERPKPTQRVLVWVFAFALAIAAGLTYAFLNTDLSWWAASAAAVPLCLLVLMRHEWLERKSERESSYEPPYGGTGDGPWGPP